MNHRGPLPHRMDAPDRHNGQTNKRTDGHRDASLRPSVRLLDGVSCLPPVTHIATLRVRLCWWRHKVGHTQNI